MVIVAIPNCAPQGRFVSQSAFSAFRLRSPVIVAHAAATSTRNSTLAEAPYSPDLGLVERHHVATNAIERCGAESGSRIRRHARELPVRV
jgi:hypothetical protein